MRIAVILGSEQGPVSLVDEALGRRLRGQLNARGVGWLSAARSVGAGGGLAHDVAGAVAAEFANVRAGRRRGRTLLVSLPWQDDTVAVLDGLADLEAVTELTVRLVVERQDRMAEHALVDGIRAGNAAVEASRTATIDHASSVRALTAMPRVASVTASPYELALRGEQGLTAWIDGLLADVGLQGRLDLRPLLHGDKPLQGYRSYSPCGLLVGRTLLPELTTPAEFELLHQFLTASFPATAERLLPATTRAAIVARHRLVNHDFFASCVPQLPPDSYGDDAATHLLAGMQPAARVPPPSRLIVVRRRAGTIKRAVLRRVALRDRHPRRSS